MKDSNLKKMGTASLIYLHENKSSLSPLIWMSFQNSTQYKEKQSFQVAFEQGKVISIKKIEGEQS